MNEEKNLNYTAEENEMEQNEIISDTEISEIEQIETERKRGDYWRRLARPRYIALSILALVLVVFAVIYLIANREGQGKAVPAPRTVSFGQDDTGGNTASNLPAEQTLTLAPEQIEQIKLETATVGETLSSEVVGATSTGVVQANEYAETPVISLVGGVIRNVSAELGEYVRQGETVAVVYSDELAAAESNYLAMVAESDEARKRYNRALELSDVSQEARTELDQAEAALKIAQAKLTEERSDFERTVKLEKIGAASRQESEAATTELKTAQANSQAAKDRLERARRLLKINPERKNEIDRALAQLRTTEAKTDAERQKLLVLGLSPQNINQVRATRRVSSAIPINAPVSGTVTAREVNNGEVVSANKELYKVTNLNTVWVIAEVYEKDLSQIRSGSGATVTSDAFPGRVFRGQVTYIDPNFNQTTRTAQIRVVLENPNQIFKIGQYVNVAFGSMGMAERTAPVVPSSAVQTINNRQVVFLATDQPNVFTLRQVRLGSETDGRYVVLDGVNVGDKVITNGSFLLRAEWIKQNPEG
jgi:RND family efflux transporter MFP subunit